MENIPLVPWVRFRLLFAFMVTMLKRNRTLGCISVKNWCALGGGVQDQIWTATPAYSLNS